LIFQTKRRAQERRPELNFFSGASIVPDPRITRLADVLINYSCAVKEGEKILIEAIDVPHFFTSECVRLARAAGGLPIVKIESNEIKRAQMLHGSRASWEFVETCENFVMKQADCYIGARGSHNVSELSDVPGDQQAIYENTVWKNVHIESRVKGTRWVVLRWPHPSMAQMAEMSTPAFEDYYYNVCTLDYARMATAMRPLKDRMEQTNRVRIVGPRDTDLTFSIQGIPAVPCDGRLNIPDGEVFTAPVRESINGVMHYNAPSLYRGTTHTDVRFEFRDGKIVAATSSSTEKLNEVLDADEGARYCGEFAIGFNPYCTRPMKDILFDEKIAGSIHLTPGACYDDAPNGNKSDIHWDLVLIQRPEYGGGEMYFDDKLVRKDGLFVVDDLKPLNPDQLTR